MTLRDRLLWLFSTFIASAVLAITAGLVWTVMTKNSEKGFAAGGATFIFSVTAGIAAIVFLHGTGSTKR